MWKIQTIALVSSSKSVNVEPNDIPPNLYPVQFVITAVFQRLSRCSHRLFSHLNNMYTNVGENLACVQALICCGRSKSMSNVARDELVSDASQ